MFVFYTRQAQNKITEEITLTHGKCESGGVLIGYQFFICFFVIDVTASHSTGNMADIEFVLDGSLHTAMAKKIIDRHLIKPLILGIWHSHVGLSDSFSVQDRIANRLFAKVFGTSISALVVGLVDCKIITWRVDADGSEELCILI